MKKYLLIYSFLAFIYADPPVFYLSPGLQIGINSTGNFFFSGQITTGVIPFDMPIIIGTTIGKRYYYNGGQFDSYGYIDGQVSFGGILGIGMGTINRSATITYYDNYGDLQKEIIKEKYTKYKLWGGAIALFSYDYINSPSGKHNFGVFGVLPIPFGDINF